MGVGGGYKSTMGASVIDDMPTMTGSMFAIGSPKDSRMSFRDFHFLEAKGGLEGSIASEDHRLVHARLEDEQVATGIDRGSTGIGKGKESNGEWPRRFRGRYGLVKVE